MKARLIAYTKPVDANQLPDEFIAFCARVSNPANQNNTLTSAKLLNYLMNNKHWSPFEMANAVMEIKTTRDIARQILRHRSFSFQEFSQRYADPTQMEFEFREARLQDAKNRQNSIETDDKVLQSTWKVIQEKCIEQSIIDYKWAIDHGIAKEVARSILPEGLTPSTLYMNGTIRSWIHYVLLRSGNGTQKEHREVALACADQLIIMYPFLKGIFENFEWDHEKNEITARKS